MLRRAKFRQRVNQLALTKNRKSNCSIQRNIFEQIENLIPKKYVTFSYEISEFLYKLVLRVCCKLNFIQLSIDGAGKVRMGKTKWELLAHYFVLGLQTIRVLYMIIITTGRVLDGMLDLVTFLCIGSTLPFVSCFCICASLLFRPQDTAQLINTSNTILSFYSCNGKVKSVFQNPKTTVLIILNVLTSATVAFTCSALGFVVDQYPTSLYHTAILIFGKPELIASILLKLLVWPLELLMLAHPMALIACNGMIILAQPNIILECTNEIRKMCLNSFDSWIGLRRKYYLLHVYASVCNVWDKFMIVPTLLSVSSAIVICLYSTIRHTDIPFLVYLGIAAIALILLILLFWVFIEVLSVIQSTEAIVSMLSKKDEPYIIELPPKERQYLRKYGKATRPVGFDIGNFVDYSVEVAIGVWDEILNQLLFLLTF